ncbi:MAG: CHAT domain-containing protein [Deltaproteobacteria bacterium]|nr:CHAT domain-containing protein [Deltaproteobacteria bacterium]
METVQKQIREECAEEPFAVESQDGFCLILEVLREGESLNVRLCHKRDGLDETLQHYEKKDFDYQHADQKCRDIVRLLNTANVRGILEGKVFEDLKNNGIALFETLLTHAVQHDLAVAPGGSLTVVIDDNLVQIPWELLYDGQQFLCRKFNFGRKVRTRQKAVEPLPRQLDVPLKMGIVCDPAHDLKNAYEEGNRIRKEFENDTDVVRSDLFARQVEAGFLKDCLKNYDVVHYAGHAHYVSDTPSESAWLLKDSRLTAHDILQMSRTVPMPALVFANACQSGQTEAWSFKEDCHADIFGLAHAFLMSGVRHYIGTFWEVLDEPCCEFSLAFYRSLFAGRTVGESVRLARQQLVATYGEENIIWASYMLYGDPDSRCAGPEGNIGADRCVDTTMRERAAGSQPAVTPVTRALPHAQPMGWMKKGAGIAAAAVLVGLMMFGWPELVSRLKSPQHSPVTPEHGSGMSSVELVTLLSQKYEQQLQQQPDSRQEDAWSSRPLAISIPDMICDADVGLKSRDQRYFMSMLYQRLGTIAQVSLVERARLDEILSELQVGTAAFADQDVALVLLGRLLGARLICRGEIFIAQDRPVVSLRVLETATSKIVATLVEDFGDTTRTAAELAGSIRDIVAQEYPLRGRVVKADPEHVLLNIGKTLGVKTGDRFQVYATRETFAIGDRKTGYDDEIIGVVQVREVKEQVSSATFTGEPFEVEKGMRVEKIKQ